jgi:inositol transport system ATP-binding protein
MRIKFLGNGEHTEFFLHLNVDMTTDALSPLVLDQVTCDYPGIRALDHVSLAFSPGEIHALVGENGAGKSTLLKVIAGVIAPTEGKIRIGSQNFPLVRNPEKHGIRLVPQEPELVADLSIAENLLLGNLPVNRWGMINWKAAFHLAKDLLSKVGLENVPPQRIVTGLGVAEQELIEIARSLAGDGKIFLLDEPTASLSQSEVTRLKVVLRDLRQKRKTVVYISHRLDEVFSFCDRVSVLRDGKLVGSMPVSESNPDDLVRKMVGRDITFFARSASAKQYNCENELQVENLRSSPVLLDASFGIRRGEILGIAGLVGSGRTELLETISGVRPISGGKLLVQGREISVRSPRDAIRAGIALIPEDRKKHGLALRLSISDNLAIPNLSSLHKGGFLRLKMKQDFADRITARLGIRCRSVDEPVLRLSGGNQQKVVLGKWLGRQPRILLLDEPTRGIDVGAKAELYEMIREMARAGMAVIVVSSELLELLSLSDRIVVMREGEIAGELEGQSMNEEAIMRLATPGYRGSLEVFNDKSNGNDSME